MHIHTQCNAPHFFTDYLFPVLEYHTMEAYWEVENVAQRVFTWAVVEGETASVV